MVDEDAGGAGPRESALARRPFLERLRRGDSYGLLLILIVVAYVLSALIGGSLAGRAVLAALFSMMLLLALYTSHVRGRAFRATALLLLLLVVAATVQAGLDREIFRGSGYLSLVPLLAAPLVVTVRIFRHPHVDVETILGAICAYLLIAIAFSGIYGVLNHLEDGGFFTQTDDPSSLDFLYFSFVTITTLGFGDLSPATNGGKVAVTLEALLGQVFLVTIVAGIVSTFGREQPLRTRAAQRAAREAAESEE